MRRSVLMAVFVLLCLPRHAVGQDKSWRAVTNHGDSADLGRGIQRTMTLLSSSNAQHRPTVRILLYGQSITAGPWGVMLEEHLRKTYPHANLVYERKPLSGFSTERLVKTAEADLYPWPLRKERWTLKATQDPVNSEVYSFSVHGSETRTCRDGRPANA